jgi:hypothetical protein
MHKRYHQKERKDKAEHQLLSPIILPNRRSKIPTRHAYRMRVPYNTISRRALRHFHLPSACAHDRMVRTVWLCLPCSSGWWRINREHIIGIKQCVGVFTRVVFIIFRYHTLLRLRSTIERKCSEVSQK